MVNPINIKAELPGEKQKIIGMICYGMQEIGPLTSVTGVNNKAGLICNSSVLWYGQEIVKKDFDWARNEEVLDIMIDVYSKLDLFLWQACAVGSGSYFAHIRDLTITAEYYTDVPPPLCDVRVDVKNRETGANVSKAEVALMSGTTVVARGYTDGGSITFHNIDEGSYMVRITASGYDTLELAVEVKSPSVWYIARLIPIPVTPLPWWVVPVVVGTVVLGGGAVAYSVLKKPAPPTPIIVTR